MQPIDLRLFLILTGSNDMAVFAIIATDGTVAPGLWCLVNELG
jgi:hypothetical protein